MATVLALREAGQDVVHLREEFLHRLPDDQIMAKAASERRIVVTFDLDFGELLAAARTMSPSVIIFRLRNPTPPVVTAKLFRVLTECETVLDSGAIVIVEDLRIRIRRLPIQPT